MPKLKLDSVILFALVVSVVMTYGLSPGTTPYWLFGIIFLLFGVNLFLPKVKHRTWITWIIIILTIGSVYFSAIVVRHRTAPVYEVHDIILQLEAATRYLVQGINPYAADYFATPLEEWHYGEGVNPALFHFVMPPFYLLSFLPFYYGGVQLFNLVDGRLPLLFAFVGILVLLHKMVRPENRPLSLTLFAFNPATINYFIEGRSDFQMFFWLLSSLFLLAKDTDRTDGNGLSGWRYAASGVLMGLAFATKQSAWPIFPLYAAFLWYRRDKKGKMDKKDKRDKFVLLIKRILPFAITFGVIILPFLWWDWRAFVDSTIFYLSGSLETSYPISGYGFGMLLHQFGLINNLQAYFPFWIPQLLVGFPVLVWLIKQMKRNTSVRYLLFAYGIFLFVFWYFSRYFNNSHVGFLSSVFLTAYFLKPEPGVNTV